MKTIAILIFDGCMASSVTGPADIFNISNSIFRHFNANADYDIFNVRLLSVNNKAVQSSSGIMLEPTMTLDELANIDVLLIGGYHYVDEVSLELHLKNISPFSEILHKFAEQGSYICTVCTGSFMLAQSGLLDNCQATTSWWLAPLFARKFKNIELRMDQLVIRAEKIWTAGATTAYTSLCIALVEIMAGHQLSSQLSRVMLVDNNRLSQLPFMNVQRALGHTDKAISDCQYWLQERLAQNVSLDDMAQYCTMSQRTFIRRFKAAVKTTPASYLQQLRIDATKQLLENTNHTVEHIVNQVGYEDVSAFRRLFSKHVQLTPQAYRKSFA